jgi:hypothetical protein
MAARTLARCARPLESALVASVLLLQGCPLSDDYYIDENVEDGSRGGVSGWGGSFPTGGSSRGGTGTTCADCPPGCYGQSRDGRDYMFCTTDRPYAMAEMTCRNAGMSLVIIDDAEEDAWVWTTLDRAYMGIQPFAFMGANDRAEEGEWRFANDELFWSGEEDGVAVGDRYVNWGADQPNDLSPVTLTQEDCGSITLADGSWNDARCELACPFVCEGP